MNSLMGIDLGTTGLKVALFSAEGLPIDTAYCEYPILTPRPGYVEQDPEDWWEGFVSACHELRVRRPLEFSSVAGIGICGQMHTQVYLDRQDRILRPAITWMDQRSNEIVSRIQQDIQAKELIFNETYNFVSTTYTAPQVRWVIENQPEVWRETASVLVAKDYLKYLLTGVKAIDYADASGTLLFNVGREAWSQEAFSFFEIPRSHFPEVLPSDEIIGKVSKQASEITGIKEGTPVVNGSSDNSASALGSGMIRPGQVTLIIGTAGVITVCSAEPLVDQQHRTLCWHYCLRDRWVTLGIMQTAGESLHWFKNAFEGPERAGPGSSGDIFERYNQEIESIPDGCNGLIFLPYLNGERTPYWDPYARGVFFGINLSTEKTHFIKAIMEGVSYGLLNNLETIESLGIQISEIRAVGGGLKSRVWLDVLGKILRKPVATIGVNDTANLGNILLCGKALGIYPSYEEIVPRLASTDVEVYFPEGTDVHKNQYKVFLKLYDQLKDTFQMALGS